MYYNSVDPLWMASPTHMKIFFNNKKLPPQKPSTAPTTHPMINPCGTGHPPDD